MPPVDPPSAIRALEPGENLSLASAVALREAGVGWRPQAGDRFVLVARDMDTDVFVVSDMVADVHHFPSGPVIGFNGTVEWALDSVDADAAVWLPAEDQLRRLLGDTARRLERAEQGWRVDVRLPGEQDDRCFTAAIPAEAYAQALLELLRLVHD